MQTTPEKNWRRILWRSFVTSSGLAIIETILLMLLLTVIYNVELIFGNSSAGTVDNFSVISLISGCAFVLCMRTVLGFTVLNLLVWAILAGSPLRLPMLGLVLTNGMSVFLMFCVWDSKYDLLHEVFTVYGQTDIREMFNIYRGILLCSLLSPLVLPKLSWLPTVLPWVLRSPSETLKENDLPPRDG